MRWKKSTEPRISGLGTGLVALVDYVAPPRSKAQLWGVLLRKRVESRFDPKRVEAFKSKHIGEEIVVLAAGPSLAKTNLQKLEGKPVIILNRAYKLLDRIRPSHSYWIIQDSQRAHEFSFVPRTLFTASFRIFGATWHSFSLRAIAKEDIILLEPIRRQLLRIRADKSSDFSKDLSQYISNSGGKSVIFSAIQLAAYMGAIRIVLLGYDLGTSAEGASYFDNPMPHKDLDRFVPQMLDATSRYKKILDMEQIDLVNGSAWTKERILSKTQEYTETS